MIIAGTWAIKSQTEMKLTRIRSMKMNRGSSLMSCFPMEDHRLPTHPIHLIMTLVNQIQSTLTATGHLQKKVILFLLIPHTVHLRFQAQHHPVRLAQRPTKTAHWKALKITTGVKNEEIVSLQMNHRSQFES